MPKVSIVLPVYNAADTIERTIASIISQTFHDWELLVINEHGSDDGSREIIKKLMRNESRIVFYQNDVKIGLAESINFGILKSQGEYIARADADDYSYPSRIAREVEYLDQHGEVIVVGSWQKHYGKKNWIHESPEQEQKCKANLLFQCDICHSTVMFRKEKFISNKLLYSGKYQQEDYELWTRALQYGEIANIPEVLGDYLEGDNNISIRKEADIKNQSGLITANALRRFLGIHIKSSEFGIIRFYDPILWSEGYWEKRRSKKKLKKIIKEIYKANYIHKYCDNRIMLECLFAFWRWQVFGDYRYHDKIHGFNQINEVFDSSGSEIIPYRKSLLRLYKYKIWSLLSIFRNN